MDYENCSYDWEDDINIRECCSDALVESGGIFYGKIYKACACAYMKNYYGVDDWSYYYYCGVDSEVGYEVSDCDIIGSYGDCNSECDEYKSCYCLNEVSTGTLTYTDLYEDTTLSSHGEFMTLDDVPKSIDDTFCDFCSMTTIVGREIDPCTMTYWPVSAYDCAGNFCPEFDFCSNFNDPEIYGGSLSDHYIDL